MAEGEIDGHERNNARLLSPQLEQRALEFRTASDERMARDNAGEAPQETLFHYTSEEAFRNIVRTEQLWFTSIYQMDDREELNFGYGISRSILQSASDSGDVVIRAFCEPLIRDDLRADIRQTFDFYSVSFGTKDDPNQWSRYADGGKGLAIGLAPPFFLPPAGCRSKTRGSRLRWQGPLWRQGCEGQTRSSGRFRD